MSARTAPGTATPAATAAASALDRDYRYRLARKNVHVAFANLGQAFQRMMLEPKSVQKFVPELNDLLVRSHVLASQITAAAPLLRTSAQLHDSVSLQPQQRALSVVRENLTEAEWRELFADAGLEVAEVRIFDHPVEFQPWLDRTDCTGADAERAAELLAHRLDDGYLRMERIALRAELA